MKTKFLLPLFLLAVGCTSEKTDQNEDQIQTTEVAETFTCYVSVVGQDTTTLRVQSESDGVTGVLSYNFYEKDDNTGTFNGEMHGDTLLADYTFMSEGTESVRQVAFLKKDNGFVEGYGDIEEKDGKMVFKNTGSLDFGSGTAFEKVPCED